ncbi:MAG TPA: ATP synthase subunit I [Steroidobacter sp.]|nr:ATP synthase subunit I [Steroidobacter sp.]
MSGNALANAARQSLRILRWQLVWIAVFAVVCAGAFGARAGWSALTGGGIGLIWTVYMAATLYRHSRDHGAHMSALSFVTGWLIKVSLTFALLIAVFRSGAFAPLALLGGLFGALVSYWAWLTFRAKKNADRADGE